MSILQKLDVVEQILKHQPGRHPQQRHAGVGEYKSPSSSFESGRFTTKLGASVTVRRKGDKTLAVSIGGRRALNYKRNDDGDYVRQGQKVVVSGDVIDFVDV